MRGKRISVEDGPIAEQDTVSNLPTTMRLTKTTSISLRSSRVILLILWTYEVSSALCSIPLDFIAYSQHRWLNEACFKSAVWYSPSTGEHTQSMEKNYYLIRNTFNSNQKSYLCTVRYHSSLRRYLLQLFNSHEGINFKNFPNTVSSLQRIRKNIRYCLEKHRCIYDVASIVR